MALIDGLLKRFKSMVNPGQPLGSTQVYTGQYSDTGQAITPTVALTCTTVNACVQAIATELAKLPWSVMSIANNGRVIARDHPVHRLLSRDANPDMSALMWRELMITSAALTGNGYSHIERDVAGRPVALHYLRPDLMNVIRLGTGEIAYIYSGSEGRAVFSSYDIFHLQWLSVDGLLGYSPISLARQSIGLAIAQETFGASYFKNASRPSGALVADKELSDEALQRIRESWEARMKGVAAAGSVAVLEGGLKWQPISLSPDDSQWLQSREFQRDEICSIFRVPPSVIGMGQNASYASGEQQNRAFVSGCLSSWSARLAAEAQRKLLRAEEAADFCTEISFDVLLKSDVMTRYQTFSIARQFGFLSVNEIRAEIGRGSIGEEGDTYLQPTNMVPASTPFGGTQLTPPGTEEPAMTGIEPNPDAVPDEPIARWLWRIFEEEIRNCGTGAGGFASGNDCAKGGGGGASDRPSARTLAEFIADPKNADGFTTDPYVKNQPDSGIMVSELPQHELKISRDMLVSGDGAKAIDAWLDKAWSDIEGRDDRFIGGWYNAGEGVFYLDVATRFENGQDERALEAARDAKQLAVFNLATMKATWVKYPNGDARKPDGWDTKYADAIGGMDDDARQETESSGSNKVRSSTRRKTHGTGSISGSSLHLASGDRQGEGARNAQGVVREDRRRAQGEEGLTERDCGTGAGGFQPGNSCAKGGDGGSDEPVAVTADTMKGYAEKVDGGATADPELDGALVPKDPETIAKEHERQKQEVADRIGVPSDWSPNISNSAKTRDELAADAESVGEEFKSMLRSIADETETVPNFGPGDAFAVKTRESLSRKVEAKLAGNSGKTEEQVVSQICDSVRGTLIADSPEQLGDALRQFKSKIEADGGKMRVGNIFSEGRPDGYSAVHTEVELKTSTGRSVLAEVQFHLKSVHDGSTKSAKEQAHKLYEKARTGKGGAKALHAMQLIFATAVAVAVGTIGGVK